MQAKRLNCKRPSRCLGSKSGSRSLLHRRQRCEWALNQIQTTRHLFNPMGVCQIEPMIVGLSKEPLRLVGKPH
jgi:hypothetical protein